MGGSGRAASDATEMGRINPAGLVQLEKYYLGGQVTRQGSRNSLESSSYGVTLTDGTVGLAFPGSFTYESIRYSNSSGFRADGQLFHLAIAGLVAKGVSIGISASRLEIKPEGGEKVNRDNIDFGVLAAFSPQLAFALVFENLLGKDDEVLLPLQRPTTASVGVQFVANDLFRVRGDYSYLLEDNEDLLGRLGLGIESKFLDLFKFRLGFQEDGIYDHSFLTAGFGWHGPRLRIDYSYQYDQRSNGAQIHSLDLWLDF